jgi:hypothetical protein
MTDTTNLDPASQPRQRPRRVRVLAPREFIKLLQTQYPDDPPEAICEHYKKRVRLSVLFDDRAAETLVMRPLEEWLQNNVAGAGTADTKPPRNALTPEQRAEAVETRDALVDQIARKYEELIEAEVTTRLLEYQTTYGKPLGDCTGAECQRLSRRYGAFFAEIGKRLNPHDHVRQHLSEAELQAIARQHRLLGPKADR